MSAGLPSSPRPRHGGGPPDRWAESLRRMLPPGPAGDALLGDLEEEFRRRARGSRLAARLWYLGGALRLGGDYLTERLRGRRHGLVRPTRPRKARRSMLDELWQDLRFSLRTLTRSPGFTAAVILTIALGIGANTAIFTVVNGILLRPLPFPESERAVVLCETHERFDTWCGASAVNAADWGRASDTLDAVGVARDNSYLMQDGGESESVFGVVTTPGFFEVLDAGTTLGRLFTGAEVDPGSNGVVVLGHGLWRSRFGADPGVIGRQIRLDGQPVTVIGVMEADVWVPWYGRSPGIWAPLTLMADDPGDRSWRGFRAVGRLAEDATLAQAREELAAIRAGLARAHPEANQEYGLRVESLRDRITGPVCPRLLTFLGAVGLVLLVGCANVANLMLARATDRTQEFAVRASLGAGRGRLVRQLLTESLMLASVGGVLGLALSVGATRAVLALAPRDIPRLEEVSVDGNVLLFTLAAALLTAALFGLAPALRAARTDLGQILKGARVAGGAGGRARDLLVVGELALATILLVGAGLLTRSFVNLLDWDPGFDRDNVVPIFILTSPGSVPDGRTALAQQERIAGEIEALPGVTSVGMTSAGPLFGGTETGQARPAGDASDAVPVRWFDAGPGYFPTMGISVVRGRNFTDRDTGESPPVSIVNETLARRLWPGQDPLGETVVVQLGDNELASRVVGVVQDLRPLDPEQPVEAQVYWPRRQFVRYGTYLVLRTAGDPAAVERTVRERLEALDPDLQFGAFVPLEQLFDRNLVSPRFNLALVGIFAAVALVLAAIGTYGVIAYSVAARTREIGIRIALGAGERAIRARVIGNGMRLAGLGLVLGLAGGLALSRTLSSMLHGVPPSDPVTLAAVAATFGVVSVAACWLPARRASRLDPLDALRSA